MTLLDSPLFASFTINPMNDNGQSPSTSGSRACLACRVAHKSCDRGKPCTRCISRGIAHLCCEPSTKKRGRPRKWKEDEQQPSSPSMMPTSSYNSSPITQHSTTSFDSPTCYSPTNNFTPQQHSVSPLYNVIPSPTIPSPTTITCKSPTTLEEALFTETLKKTTQSKKLKNIKIMNYNPNHRETLSPKFTFTSTSENKSKTLTIINSSPIVEQQKQKSTHSATTADQQQPASKKRKASKNQSTPTFATSYQTSSVVSTPVSNNNTQQQTMTPISTNSFSPNFITSQSTYPPCNVLPPTITPMQSNMFVNSYYAPQQYDVYSSNYNQQAYPSPVTMHHNNQPHHRDEEYRNFKLPSIHNLLASLP